MLATCSTQITIMSMNFGRWLLSINLPTGLKRWTCDSVGLTVDINGKHFCQKLCI